MTDLPVLGDELRERREALDLSVNDVSRKLHIPADVIQAFERGDRQKLPASCFASGFVKTYCAFLGVAPERYLVHYTGAPERGVRFLKRRRMEKGHPAWIGELITWAAVCSIFAIGWLAYTVIVRPQTGPEGRRVEAETVGLQAPATPTNTPPAAP